jgi:hypothetical protein
VRMRGELRALIPLGPLRTQYVELASATRNSADGGVGDGNEQPVRGKKISQPRYRIAGKYSASCPAKPFPD